MADGYKQEFIQIQVAGLQALYNGRKGLERTAIVGYLRDEKGELVAAVVGDYAKVVPAASIKNFCSVQWSETTVAMSEGGTSIFEKVFGRQF